MRRELLESESAGLRELKPGSAAIRPISQRVGQPYLAVWYMLECLEREGFVRVDWTADRLPRPRRIYSLTVARRQAVDYA
jgi:DNA-binding PadR family transcriptional regulator